MLRAILTNKVVIMCLFFFILMVGGSLFYRWYVNRDIQAADTRHQQLLQQYQAAKKTQIPLHRSPRTNDMGASEPSEASVTTDGTAEPVSEEPGALPIENTEGIIDPSDEFLPDLIGKEEFTEMPLSPFGFGPYPEVPEGYPENIPPSWTWSAEKRQASDPIRLKDFELIGRVLIKLWNQGDHNFVGAQRDSHNGLVYPTYPNTAYAIFKEVENPDGTFRRIMTSVSAGPGVPKITPEHHRAARIPGVRIIDAETAGINPYEFLNLK